MGIDMPAPEIPFPPMEAELVRELPEGDGWQYEPKWDGFRGLLENVGGELALSSREHLPPRAITISPSSAERGGALDFDAMQSRLHPAESRIRKLAAEIPADYM